MELVLFPTLGLGLWLLVVQPRARRLERQATAPEALLLFMACWLLAQVVAPLAALLLLPDDLTADTRAEDLPLLPALNAQLTAYGVASLAALAGARRWLGSFAGLGLRRTGWGLALVAGPAAWSMLAPLLVLSQQAGQELLRSLGRDGADQAHLVRFVQQGGGGEPWAWVMIAVLLPFCEELLYRGALYGGLRRSLPPWVAMVASGALFGVSHDVSVMLPVTVLGIALAWLYERTGSLAVPFAVHALQNGLTLLLASAPPPGLIP